MEDQLCYTFMTASRQVWLTLFNEVHKHDDVSDELLFTIFMPSEELPESSSSHDVLIDDIADGFPDSNSDHTLSLSLSITLLT
jgi:hypothetical protein